MRATWSKDFPRLYDLYCESDQQDEANYFATFYEVLENPYVRPYYERLEEELGQLDDVAWQGLKRKVFRYVGIRNSQRGYSQLFDLLNEAKGYLYLKSQGCEEIRFIPEDSDGAPDLITHCGGSVFLLEVKTINKSKEENDIIKANSERPVVVRMQVIEGRLGLDDSLKRKITGKINKAKRQLMSYACDGIQRRIAYLIIHLDIALASDSRNIDELAVFIEEQGNNQVEIKHCLSG